LDIQQVFSLQDLAAVAETAEPANAASGAEVAAK